MCAFVEVEDLQQVERSLLDFSFLAMEHWSSKNGVNQTLFLVRMSGDFDVFKNRHAPTEPDVLKRSRHTQFCDRGGFAVVDCFPVQLNGALVRCINSGDEVEY